MAKRSGVSFEISTLIFVLFSLTFTKCQFTWVSAMDGGKTKLNFSYPCDSARVTLQYGMRFPFYDSANPESLLLPENQELVFENVEYETENDNYCLFQLTINPVLKSDEGGYILIAYDGDENILQDTRFGLIVDYPPGKASCKWGEENIVHDWRSLECTAWYVSLLWEIICYQNEIRVPISGRHNDIVSILEQTMWVKYSQPVFCCALVVGRPVDRCECKDYTWDPYSDLTEPCPVTMVTTHQEPSTSSQSPTSSPTKEVTQETKKNHRSKYVVLHSIYPCVIGILIIIIISRIIALRMSNRKDFQVKGNTKITCSQPDHVHIEYTSVETAQT